MANKFSEALRGPASVARERSGRTTPARRGTKHVGGYFAPEVSKQLRQIALDEDTSVQALLEESLNMLFASRSKPAIAVIASNG